METGILPEIPKAFKFRSVTIPEEHPTPAQLQGSNAYRDELYELETNAPGGAVAHIQPMPWDVADT